MANRRIFGSVHKDNTLSYTAMRDRAGVSREAVRPTSILSGRRFRQANKLTHEQAATLDVLVRQPDGSAARPTLTFAIDSYSRMITGWRMS